jgi:ketosteroid isomerase-like protein
VTDKDQKLEAIDKFFAAYASYDLNGMRAVLTDDIEWTIPGHHPLSGTKHGVEEVAAFFTQLGKSGFQVDRVVNLSADQHQMDAFVWTNYSLAPIPDRLAGE